ncbi:MULTISPECIES: hypothetical protein [Gammaproteobacteria]|uniref:hypothetical protein n=1 Tax=Gammaproteobacteria TaxID=1236 RepID=UPI000E3275F4|nr:MULTISPECIES: hypothetical protein [Gammaproteobacteria]
MTTSTTVPFHLTTAGQSIRMLLQLFHAAFIAALWGAAAVGALVGYILLVAQEPVSLPLIPLDSPFKHFAVIVFIIGAIVGLMFTAFFDGFLFTKRAVESEGVALTVPLAERQGHN